MRCNRYRPKNEIASLALATTHFMSLRGAKPRGNLILLDTLSVRIAFGAVGNAVFLFFEVLGKYRLKSWHNLRTTPYGLITLPCCTIIDHNSMPEKAFGVDLCARQGGRLGFLKISILVRL